MTAAGPPLDRWALLGLALAAGLLVLLALLARGLRVDGRPFLDVKPAPPEETRRLLRALRRAGRLGLLRAYLALDAAFVLVYVPTLGLLVVMASHGARMPPELGLLALPAGLADWAEGVLLLRAAHRDPASDRLARALRTATRLKLLLLGVALGVLLLLGAAWAWRAWT